jgi:Tfp pilus assembly PilM family ATPase
MTQPNVIDPVAFRHALRAVLERAGVLGGGQVTLVLPDPVARVALLPWAEVHGKRRSDTDELIRFRLRKAVPFDVREAQVDFVRLGVRSEDPVLVAAIYRPVLRSYEEACESLGLHAGIVELTGLTLLTAVETGSAPPDRLLVNWDDGYVSFFLVRGNRLALVRTLTGEAAATPVQVARELSSTSLYYRERLFGQGLGEVLVRSAALPAAEAAAVVSQALETEARPLDAWTGLAGDYGPVAHALAGAAASLVRRAA